MKKLFPVLAVLLGLNIAFTEELEDANALGEYREFLTTTQNLYNAAVKNKGKNWVFIPIYETDCKGQKCGDFKKKKFLTGELSYYIFNNQKKTLSKCGPLGCAPEEAVFFENGITLRIQKKSAEGSIFTLNLSDLTYTHVEASVGGLVINKGKGIEEKDFYNRVAGGVPEQASN